MELHGEKMPSAASDSKLDSRSNRGSSNPNTRGQRIPSSDRKKQGTYAVVSRSTGRLPDHDHDGDVAAPRRGIVSSLFKGCF